MNLTKKMIYDEICAVITEFENGDAVAEDLCEILVMVQNNWEEVITADED